jgi:hypothetical protein
VGFFVFFLVLSVFVFFFPNALGQWAAVLWSNPEYYDSTICWNSFSLLDTRDVRGGTVRKLGRVPSVPAVCKRSLPRAGTFSTRRVQAADTKCPPPRARAAAQLAHAARASYGTYVRGHRCRPLPSENSTKS